MLPVKKQLTEIIDILPEQEQILLYEIAKRFVADDIATADDIAATNEAQRNMLTGRPLTIMQSTGINQCFLNK